MPLLKKMSIKPLELFTVCAITTKQPTLNTNISLVLSYL